MEKRCDACGTHGTRFWGLHGRSFCFECCCAIARCAGVYRVVPHAVAPGRAPQQADIREQAEMHITAVVASSGGEG